MTDTRAYRTLKPSEIASLEAQGCSAEDWSRVEVATDFDTASLWHAQFIGSVRLGRFADRVQSASGLAKPSGVYSAVIANCTIGDHTRISNVGVHIANYDIGDRVCIENIGTMHTHPGATFGNGVEISVLNEAGGREIILFDTLSAQFAYLMCLHRYRPKLIAKLRAMAVKYTESKRSDRGRVGDDATICSTHEIVDLRIGTGATIINASSLKNGTILSSQQAPSMIGANVVAEDFILAEGSSVTKGAMLDKVFIGQGCQIGRHYTAEHSAFFANCEAFHGEACSVFAGPYTVTHHKSTLLIAGLYSFYNAGSGTNASNHMYKLGPAHEGKILRGAKTGSFSYMMWPCRVGPFSVVLGKHSTTFDVGEFPFSHLEARSDGKCTMTPGLHLTTVGTVRDGAKWPKRDRRKGVEKRDAISFDVFSPYTVGKMIRANAILQELQEATDKSVEEVSVGGALVKRLMLRASQKYYRAGIDMYLLEQVVGKLESALSDPGGKLSDAFDEAAGALYSDRWVDIAGQLMPRQRLIDLEDAVENGQVDTLEAFAAAIADIQESYARDEWAWARRTYEDYFDADLNALTEQDACEMAQKLLKVKSKFLTLVKADAEKEFSESSRLGFGQDGDPEDVQRDFDEVRGLYEENPFVQEISEKIEQLRQRIENLQATILRRSTVQPVS